MSSTQERTTYIGKQGGPPGNAVSYLFRAPRAVQFRLTLSFQRPLEKGRGLGFSLAAAAPALNWLPGHEPGRGERRLFPPHGLAVTAIAPVSRMSLARSAKLLRDTP